MSRTLAAAFFLVGLAMAVPADGGGKTTRDEPIFGNTKVHQLHLAFTEAAYQKMQPPPGMKFPGFPGGPKKVEEKKNDTDVHKSAGAFGTDFPWSKGELTVNGQLFPNVGVRYKGNFTYVASAQMLRKSFKIDLDHFDETARLHGHKKINLSNGVTDAARTRETMAFALYRAAGVPAPRTAYAELTLTVPGKYDKELAGLYTMIEQVDKAFLKTHFKDGKGMLLKPENLQGGLQHFGDDWKKYDEIYRPKNDPTKEQQARLIAFTKLIHQADDVRFAKEVAGFLDIDAFLRFTATSAMMANLDSYLGFGHNFYLYLRPDTNQFAFLPWDLDLSMGMWPMGGTPEQQVNLSLDHPHLGQNKLIDRLLAQKDIKTKYHAILKELSKTCFAKENLRKELDAIEKAVAAPLQREKQATTARKEAAQGPFAGIVQKGQPLRVFLDQRADSIVAQLAGERKGYVPSGGFGPGFGKGPPGGGFGPPGGFPPKGPPGGFGPGGFLAKPLLEAFDTGKDGKVSKAELVAGATQFFKDCDKDNTGTLDEAQLIAGINRIMPRPAGFPAPPPGGFGMGNVLAGPLLKRADANKKGKITLAELVTAAETLFKEADKDNKGTLDEAALAAAVNALMPPPAFGPPGGFGPPKEFPKKDDKK
jgi:spore coat protein H